MAEYIDMTPSVDLRFGDCLAVLRELPDESVDAVVTDPPYGLADHKPAAVVTALTAWANGDREQVPDGRGFMGRDWDSFVPPPAVWDECLRVLKPGGHLVAFAGSRTYDLMGLSIRMAGFEIRDGLTWLYSQGMPKGQNVGKAIDATLLHGKANSAGLKAANASRPGEGRIGPQITNNGHMGEKVPGSVTRDQPATAEAARWGGWSATLSPAQEPIVLARKPLGGKTVAANVLAHGTGALNVDATRTGHASAADLAMSQAKNPGRDDVTASGVYGADRPQQSVNTAGRWPTNVVLSHGEDCAEGTCVDGCPVATLDEAARYFPSFRYQAKASSKERPKIDGKGHPTVKPVALMEWLVRLITPPGGLVLDPFAGTGTTLAAASSQGFRAVGVERWEFAYLLACKRLGLPEIVPAPVGVPAPVVEVDPILEAIAAAQSPVEIAQVVSSTAPEQWTPEHTAAATARMSELSGMAA